MHQQLDIKKIDEKTQWEIGQRIQNARIEKELSGADLGAYLEISANQVSRIENGRAVCTIQHMFILAQLLDVSVDYLLFGKEKIQNVTPQQMESIKNLIAQFT